MLFRSTVAAWISADFGIRSIAGGFFGTATGPITGGNYLAVKPWNAAHVPFAVQGVASQTADLTQWVNSTGTVIASIDATGSAYFVDTVTLGKNRSSDGASTINFNAVSGQSSNQAVIQRGSGYNGALVLTNYGSSTILLQNGQAGSVVATVKGYASQTADYFKIQNSGGADLLTFNSSNQLNVNYGSIYGQSLRGGSNNHIGFAGVSAFASNANYLGLGVKGYPSQIANLTEWQNSSGTVLAKVDKDGNINTPYISASYGSFGVNAPAGSTISIGTNSASAKIGRAHV